MAILEKKETQWPVSTVDSHSQYTGKLTHSHGGNQSLFEIF